MLARLFTAALLATLALAAPVVEERSLLPTLKNFYLLASPLRSKAATNATGLNLVDPYYQTNYLLRAQPDAGGSLFNLTLSGTLETISSPPHQFSSFTFASNVDADTGSVFFLQESGTKHQFSFTLDGFLAYKGDDAHWTLCVGELYQSVINYKGTDASCEHVYIFQQKTAPPSS